MKRDTAVGGFALGSMIGGCTGSVCSISDEMAARYANWLDPSTWCVTLFLCAVLGQGAVGWDVGRVVVGGGE